MDRPGRLKRLLYFSRDYTPHDHRFLSALSASGLEVGYLRLEDAGRAWESRPLTAGVRLIHWAGGQGLVRRRDGLRLLVSLRRVLSDFKPDVLHAGPLQSVGLLAALSGFRRLVSVSWGYDLLIDARRGPAWRWATRYTLQHSAAMLGDCQTIRDLAITYGMHPQRIVTFPWGVDLEHFSPASDDDLRQRLGWPADAFVLLSTRGWSPIYGIEEVARGFVQAAQSEPRLHLLMLGGGPLAAKLRQIFIAGGVLDRVRFPGQIGQAELPRYYRAADLYVSASHSDGSSISLLEALACARPVLVSDIPGNAEWVTPGQQGWLFREGDAASLAQGILHAAGLSADERQSIGQTARQTTEQRADWNKNFPQLFDAYRMALDTPAG